MSRNHTALDWQRWQATRRAAFERDCYRCTKCGKAGRLEAHHEPPLDDGADPYDVDGVSTRCRDCHINEHRRKLTPDEKEWADYVRNIALGVTQFDER